MNQALEQELDRYLAAVLEANKALNLTRITNPEQARILHIEDSLSALPELGAAPQGAYGDLGSGAGFPGVPLALASGRPVVLVESVKKKAQAVQDIVGELGLENVVSVFAGRCEDLALEKPESFAVLTARALASLPSLLELASPLLQRGGRLICLKGPEAGEELSWAGPLKDKLGMRLVQERAFELPYNEGSRIIYTFEKFADPQVSLPRRPGAAQNRPYKK